MSDYTKVKHIVNALNDIEDIAVRIEFDETLQRTYYKVAFVVDNLVSAGFTEDEMITLSDTINKAVKKALLKTERSLLAELEGELGSVKDSLTRRTRKTCFSTREAYYRSCDDRNGYCVS